MNTRFDEERIESGIEKQGEEYLLCCLVERPHNERLLFTTLFVLLSVGMKTEKE